MRVALVSNFRGGLKQFVVNLSRGLTERGFNMEILCPVHLTARQIDEVGTHVRVRMGPEAAVRVIAGRYDIVHCNIAALGLLSEPRRLLDRIPLVQTFHGIPQWWTEPGMIAKTTYAMEFNALSLTARSAGARISVSHFVRSVIQGWLRIDSSVIHHGISRCPIQKSREESRKELGIEDERLAILFVGRLHPCKDPYTLLKAVARVAREGRKVRLFVVGDGPLSIHFRAAVRALGMQGLVTIWSSASRVFLHSLYSAADIFCLPSVNEAFGIVLLEAMDHSVPLVVSESGALPEVVGDAGLKFTTGDEIDLSRKLARLLDDETLRHILSERGRVRLENQFSLKSMVDGYTRIYEEVAR